MYYKGILLAVLAASSLNSCQSTNEGQVSSTIGEASILKTNSILKDWDGPYQGVPNFDKVKLEDLMPAAKYAMADHLRKIDEITSQKEPATFENTIVPLEKSDQLIAGKVYPIYGVWSNSLSSPELREIQKELAPLLSDYYSKINQNEALFERVKAVYQGKEFKTLDKDQQRVTELTYDGFVRSGADLDPEKKKRFAAINKELSALHLEFSNHVLADEEKYTVYITKDQLGGLPDSFIKAAAATAKSNGKEGLYAITNTRSSMDPFLKFSTNRKLREKVWRNYYNRANNGDENDNNAVISKILKLRHERIKLLGYKDYASWRLENRMAKTPENALALLITTWEASTKRVKEEVADMQVLADQEKAGITIEPWDYRFYAEKVRQKRFDLDSNEVKQYLQLDRLREAMFFVAGELFDFTFSPVPEGSVPVYHEDVAVWEVKNKTTGEHVGLWYLDPFARVGKRSGAWASTLRSHSTFDGKKNVLATNTSNFIKPPPGEALLVSWDDATTFFHEFGHALHFLSSNIRYPTLDGGVRDYTEFQSQLLERWLSTDKVIDRFFRHNKTGEPMPKSLVAKIKKAQNFNEGFRTTEYLASALIDLKLHTTDPEGIDPQKFEAETLKALGLPKQIVMRHRTTHFGHIFSGEGYSAGYYGYLWAEVLTSDAAAAFEAAPGGYYDKELSRKLVEYLFAPRNSIDPLEAYLLFRGKKPEAEALLKDRGFISH